jgi:hypothetical protein
MIASPPKHGDADGGVHKWLFRIARQLHCHRDDEEIFKLLKAETLDCGRPVPDREIWAAIKGSATCAWQPRNDGSIDSEPSQAATPRWPAADYKLQARLAGKTPWDLYDLWEASSAGFDDDGSHAEEVLPLLFPGDDTLVCVAWEKTKAVTAPLSEFRGELETLQFIVASPMSKLIGQNLEGKESSRCLDNTGPRRFLPVEFDSGPLDLQAALLWHLGTIWPLALVVFSGNKSLQGWFVVGQSTEAKQHDFFAYALRLGACDSTWTRCQLVRAPGGLRDNGQHQVIYYFAPEVLP